MIALDDLISYTLRNVILGSAILGVVGGMLGTFALLRRQSLLGDTLAHAALPGICVAFLLTGTKLPEVLLIGAAVSGWIGTLVLLGIVRATRVKEDAALGTVLTVFFGVGILLLTYIQHGANANQTGLDRYLFGQAATLLERDIVVMAVLAAVALTALALFYKEFKLLAFDPGYAASLGWPTTRLEILLTSLIVIAVLIGLQTVGVVLMVAMLIAPAAAARQWTDRLGPMLMVAAAFGAIAGFIGSVLSSTAARVPTGPLIVLAATAILIVSLALAPRHGLVWNALRQWRQRGRTERIHVLAEIQAAVTATAGGGVGAPASALAHVPFDVRAIADARGHGHEELRRGVDRLVGAGLARRLAGDGTFALSDAGAEAAARAARNQRLWQAYLASQLDLAVEDVHLDVADIERALSPEVLAQLEKTLDGEKAIPLWRS